MSVADSLADCDAPPPAAAGDGSNPAPIRDSGNSLRELGEALLIAVLTTMVCRTFVVQAFRIPSMSMVPTLVRGDHLLVNKLRYGLHLPGGGGFLWQFDDPAAGDVVVFSSRSAGNSPDGEERDFVKRVVATAGEDVEIRGARVFVNGRERAVGPGFAAFGERDRSRRDFGPARVPAGQIFVMGDNRDSSRDSRHWGFVAVDDVIGKAVLVFWSWEGGDRFVRWERLGRRVH